MDTKALRLRLGLTAQELASTIGVSVSTVSRWERGLCQPSRLALIRLRELESKERACEPCIGEKEARCHANQRRSMKR